MACNSVHLSTTYRRRRDDAEANAMDENVLHTTDKGDDIMGFSSDLDMCLSNANFPTLGQIFSSLTDALQVVSELQDALSSAGIDVTTVTSADLEAAAATLSLSAEASALLTRVIAVVATVAVSVYLGAVLTCTAKITVLRHLDSELALAPDSSAKQSVVATMDDVRQDRVPA